MLARIDTDTELTKDERKLRRMDKDTLGEQGEVFDEWRNLHFTHAVTDAVARGVRYAGMGRNHLVYLRDKGLPPAPTRGHGGTRHRRLPEFVTKLPRRECSIPVTASEDDVGKMAGYHGFGRGAADQACARLPQTESLQHDLAGRMAVPGERRAGRSHLDIVSDVTARVDSVRRRRRWRT
jgi:hypothetical protein